MSDSGPTPERPLAARVEAMAGFGMSAGEIALLLDTAEGELVASYGREVETGSLKANLRVAECLFRRATGEGREAVTAAIFWLKARAQWKERAVHEHAAAGPLTVEIVRFSDEP